MIVPALTKFLLAASVVFLPAAGQGVDRTIRECDSDSDVVQATITKIEDVGAFSSDHGILRRIAYVESRDGESSCEDGGIWRLTRENFERTKLGSLSQYHQAIKNDSTNLFGRSSNDFNWLDVNYGDLKIPIYSGVAARLYLASVEDEIPLKSEISLQASYWKRYYNTEGVEVYFRGNVTVLEEFEEQCKVNLDLVFVLDSSGSIEFYEPGAYNRVLDFTYNFTSNLQIGPKDSQVGVIIFSREAEVEFTLNEYTTKNEVLDAITRIPYLDHATNTPDAICKLVDEMFTEAGGARLNSPTVFQLAIVMTDGMSNADPGPPCENVSAAAMRVHEMLPRLITYVIGVTPNVNQQELLAIASDPNNIAHLSSFDVRELQQSQEEFTYEVCARATTTLVVGEDAIEGGTIEQDEQVRLNLPVPEEGLTLKICTQDGEVLLLASRRTTVPNSANYEWRLQCDTCNQCEVYIEPPDDLEQGVQKRQTNEADGNVTFTGATVYVTIIGLDVNNTFSLNSTSGDTTVATLPPTLTPMLTPTEPATPYQPSDDKESAPIGVTVGVAAGGGVILILVLFTVIGWIVWVGTKRVPRDSKTGSTVKVPL